MLFSRCLLVCCAPKIIASEELLYDPLPAGSVRSTVTANLATEEHLRLVAGEHFVDTVHQITLLLDAGSNPPVIAGSIYVRYCGWEDIGVPCSCRPDLDAGDGAVIGGVFVPWGTTDHCVYPNHINQTNATTDSWTLPITLVHRETLNMRGADAEATGVSAGYGRPYHPRMRAYLDEWNFLITNASIIRPGESLVYETDWPETDLHPLSLGADRELHTLTAYADYYNATEEANENNTFAITFRYCWPPDITSRFVAMGNVSRPFWFGDGLDAQFCIRPEDVEPGSTATNTLIRLYFDEENIGNLPLAAYDNEVPPP